MTHHKLTILMGLACLGTINKTVTAQTQFTDATTQLNLTLNNSAVAWGDINNDGWPDLYQSGKVWLNDGTGKSFTPHAIPGAGSGVIVDINNDHLGDIVSYAPLGVWLNNGNSQKFTQLQFPELPKTNSRGVACGDYNNDGYLDLYYTGFEVWDQQITYPDLLLINESGKSFKLTLNFPSYRARGVTACDFDQDDDLDIYVSNYRLLPNVLWQNDGNANLTNAATTHNALATSEGFSGGHSIGAAWGDFDNDGYFDLLAGNFAHVDSRGDQPKSRFLKNTGPKNNFTFEDKGTCGIFYQESYASPAAADYDNDGDLDLYFTTVYANASFGKKNYPVLFNNNANTWQFTDATQSTGLSELPATYQAAWADYDRDGDLDLITASKLYQNQNTTDNHHWLEIRLLGDGKTINTTAVGTQIRIKTPNLATITRQVEVGTGEGNANSPILHFGLGNNQSTPLEIEIEVTWPNGNIQTLADLAPNQMHTIHFTPVGESEGPDEGA